jgi:hypothetical protein
MILFMKDVSARVACCLLLCLLRQARERNKIFRRNRNQKRCLLQEIAALLVYISYAKKVYEFGPGLQLLPM